MHVIWLYMFLIFHCCVCIHTHDFNTIRVLISNLKMWMVSLIPTSKSRSGRRQIIDDRDNYIPSNLNPIFGRMFELSATIPLDHTLTISVMDWDRLSADDLIGETSIDLENRLLSEHRALCGLPETYSKWSELVRSICTEFLL